MSDFVPRKQMFYYHQDQEQLKFLQWFDYKKWLLSQLILQKQYYQLQNDVANIKSQYTTKVTTQNRIVKNEKAKEFKKQVKAEIKKNEALKQQQIKSQVQTITPHKWCLLQLLLVPFWSFTFLKQFKFFIPLTYIYISIM